MNAKPKLFDLDSERALAGCAQMDPALFGNTIAPGDFWLEPIQKFWEVGRRLHDAGLVVNETTLLDELERLGVKISRSELIDWQEKAVSTIYAETHATTVKRYARLRELHALGQELVRGVYSGADPDKLAEGLVQQAARLREVNTAQTNPPRKTTWTVAELLSTDFPDPPWAVPNIVPVGLTLLAGRPKVGKSWLALQIAHAVATGGMALNRHVNAARVLYLALEDSPRRLKERLQKQLAPASANLTFETSWRRLPDGGLDDLRAAVERERYGLVVLDTLSRSLGHADQQDLADMTVIIGGLQELALAHDLAVLAIDHHRKSSNSESDPIDDVIGSTAKSAVADAALGLSKEQGKAGAVLKVTGRDLEWQELALSWDAICCCWQLEGTVEEVSLRGNKTKALDALRTAERELTLSDLAALTEIRPGNLLPILSELVNAGLIERCPKRGRDVPYKMR